MRSEPGREQEVLLALAGNPNCGKTTLFNAITGARQHVGNYPGITVEKKEGFFSVNGRRHRLVDLPGTYSLTAYSLEELVARDFLVHERPRLVLDIVDASNLERNLYLAVQLLELGAPILIALNMMDVAESRGITIDADELSKRLGCPVIPTVARTGKGKSELVQIMDSLTAEERSWTPFKISYGPDVDPVLGEMEAAIESAAFLTDLYPPRWTALKYLEADEQVLGQGKKADEELSKKLEAMADKVAEHLQKTLDTYPEAIIADHRYGFIAALLKGVVRRDAKTDRLFLSDQVDRVLTNRFFGPLFMFMVLYAVYQFTFTYSSLPVQWLEAGFGALADFMQSVLPEGMLRSLVVSGIIEGVGGVMSFIPLIAFMFLAIAFLEDTGYLARVAYMLDRVFRTFGLHGSSVMAYVISGGIAGGCAVPGVMATRTLRSSRERLATILTAPFMNCGAKVPVFAMLIAAFFPAHEALVMFLLTLLSWVSALLIAKFIRSTILRGPSTPFLLELPPYRLPTFKGLLIHTWERTWQYIRKAGTVILAISVLFWALMAFPQLPQSERHEFEERRQEILARLPDNARQVVLEGDGAEAGGATQAALPDDGVEAVRDASEQLGAINRSEVHRALRYSFAGRLGTALESISYLAGFEWQTNIALMAGFAAKELIISTLSTAYSLGQEDRTEEVSLSQRLANDPNWNVLKAFTLIVFIMLYAPCFVAVTCIIKESGAWKWGVFSMVFNTLVAFTVATAIYRGGLWLGIGV